MCRASPGLALGLGAKPEWCLGAQIILCIIEHVQDK